LYPAYGWYIIYLIGTILSLMECSNSYISLCGRYSPIVVGQISFDTISDALNVGIKYVIQLHLRSSGLNDDRAESVVNGCKLWVTWSIKILSAAMEARNPACCKCSQGIINIILAHGSVGSLLGILSCVSSSKATLYQSQSVQSDLSAWIDADVEEPVNWGNVLVNSVGYAWYKADTATITPKSVDVFEPTDSECGSAVPMRSKMGVRSPLVDDTQPQTSLHECDSENESEAGASTEEGSTAASLEHQKPPKFELGRLVNPSALSTNMTLTSIISDGDDVIPNDVFVHFTAWFLMELTQRSLEACRFLGKRDGPYKLLLSLWLLSEFGCNMHALGGSGYTGSKEALECVVQTIHHMVCVLDPPIVADLFLQNGLFCNMLLLASLQPHGKGIMATVTALLVRDLISLSCIVARVKSTPCADRTDDKSLNAADIALLRKSFKPRDGMPLPAMRSYPSVHAGSLMSGFVLPIQLQLANLVLAPDVFASLFNANICCPEVVWNTLLRRQCAQRIVGSEGHKHWITTVLDNATKEVSFKISSSDDGNFSSTLDSEPKQIGYAEPQSLMNEPHVQGIYLYMFMNSFPTEYFANINIMKFVTGLTFLFRCIANDSELHRRKFLFDKNTVSDQLMLSFCEFGGQGAGPNDDMRGTVVIPEDSLSLYHSYTTFAWMSHGAQLALLAVGIGRAIEQWPTPMEFWDMKLAPVLFHFVEKYVDACSQIISDISFLSNGSEVPMCSVQSQLSLAASDVSGDNERESQQNHLDTLRAVTAAVLLLTKSFGFSCRRGGTDDPQFLTDVFNRSWCIMDICMESLCRLVSSCVSRMNILSISEEISVSAFGATANVLTVSVTTLSILCCHAIEYLHSTSALEEGMDKVILSRVHRRWASSSLLRTLVACLSPVVAQCCPQAALSAIVCLQLIVGHYSYVTENMNKLNISRGDSRGLHISSIAAELYGCGAALRLLDSLMAVLCLRKQLGPSDESTVKQSKNSDRWAEHELTRTNKFCFSQINAKAVRSITFGSRTPILSTLNEVIDKEEILLKQWLRQCKEAFLSPESRSPKVQFVKLASGDGNVPSESTSAAKKLQGMVHVPRGEEGDIDWEMMSQASRSTDGVGRGKAQVPMRSYSDLESVSSTFQCESPARARGSAPSPFVSVERTPDRRPSTTTPAKLALSKAPAHAYVVREACELLRQLLLSDYQNVDAGPSSSPQLPRNVNNVKSASYNKYFGPQLEYLLTPSVVYVLATDLDLFMSSISAPADIARPLFVWTVAMQSRMLTAVKGWDGVAADNVDVKSPVTSPSSTSSPLPSRSLHTEVLSDCIVDGVYIRSLCDELFKDDIGSRDLARFVESLQASIEMSRSLTTRLGRSPQAAKSPSDADNQLTLKEEVLKCLLKDHPELGYSNLNFDVTENEDSFNL
jgi:hypothetical protein